MAHMRNGTVLFGDLPLQLIAYRWQSLRETSGKAQP